MFNKEKIPKGATLLGKKFIHNAEKLFSFFVRWTIIQFISRRLKMVDLKVKGNLNFFT